MQSRFLLPGPFRFGNSSYSKNVSKSEVGILSGIRFIVCAWECDFIGCDINLFAASVTRLMTAPASTSG